MSEAATQDDGFKWYYSLDKEVWCEAACRDHAIDMGRGVYDREFHICEANKAALNDAFFDANEVVGRFIDHNDHAWVASPDLVFFPEEGIELEVALGAAFAKWRAAHTTWQAWWFDEVRNEETIQPAANRG